MADALTGIYEYIPKEIMVLFPLFLLIGDWIYCRFVLHNTREQLAKQQQEHDEYKERYTKLLEEANRSQQTVVKHGLTFLANDFRNCAMPSDAEPICPNCFPAHKIYLQHGPGVGERAPQELKDRYERDVKEAAVFATHYRCPVCRFEARLINKTLSEVQEFIFKTWPSPLGR